MATEVCNKLIREPWMFYSNASKIPHVGGIYWKTCSAMSWNITKTVETTKYTVKIIHS